MNLDEIKDFAADFIGDLVIRGILPDCTDTDDETEFEAQDLLVEKLCKKYNVVNDTI